MIDKATVDRILEAAQIVDVVGDFVSLRRRGSGYIACCPFHHEKTPSFSVSPAKGIYKCFGCGKAGSAVSFIMEHEQLSYPDALRYLARKYGIPIVETEESEEESQERLKRESLLLVSEFAAKYFTDTMMNTDIGRSAGLGYFRERGFTDITVRKFGLGYASDNRTGLVNAARAANLNLDYLVDCGLAIKREDTGEYVDRFFDRVIFPIFSISGRIIAFGGRILRTDKKLAKYINSPETEIYVKSKSLYGLFQAKSSIVSKQKCYLVEGYTDVLSLNQAGIENVVASSGTSLTKDQIGLIKRFTNNVTVLYDGDYAGIKASLRGIDMLLAEGLQIKVVLLPDGEDPDSFSKGRTAEEIETFLAAAEKDFMSFKSDILSDEAQNDPIKKARLINDVIGSIAVMPDAITRAVYIEESSKRFHIEESILKQEVAKIVRKRQIELVREEERAKSEESATEGNGIIRAIRNSSGNEETQFDEGTFCDVAEREILYYLLKFGDLPLTLEEEMTVEAEKEEGLTVAQYIMSELQADDLDFGNPLYRKILEEYFRIREHDREKIMRHFLNHPDPEVSGLTADIMGNAHTLTIKQFVKALIPEENILGKFVPKAMLVYKSKVAEKEYRHLCRLLGECGGDMQKQKEIMEKMNVMMQVRNTFAKELKRLTL